MPLKNMNRTVRSSSTTSGHCASRLGTAGTTASIPLRWSSLRAGLRRARASVNGPDQSPSASRPAWQAAEWAPAQPAIVFGAAAPVTPPPPTEASSSPAAAATAAHPTSSSLFRLAVYTKPGCPLCDNLADRAQAVLDRAAFLPGGGALGQAGVDVQCAVERRDVSAEGREAWAAAHAGEVPVVVLLRNGGGGGGDDNEEEFSVPRPPPRVTADKLERHLAAAAAAAAAARQQ